MFKIFKKLCNEKRVILEEFIGERMSLEHAEYVKLLVKRAGEVDKTREIFGASKHQYKLNPVVSMDDIYIDLKVSTI